MLRHNCAVGQLDGPKWPGTTGQEFPDRALPHNMIACLSRSEEVPVRALVAQPSPVTVRLSSGYRGLSCLSVNPLLGFPSLPAVTSGVSEIQRAKRKREMIICCWEVTQGSTFLDRTVDVPKPLTWAGRSGAVVAPKRPQCNATTSSSVFLS